MKTIQEQLRNKSNMIFMGEKIAFGSECELMDEAANVIDKLQENIDVAINALEQGENFINELSVLLVRNGVSPEKIGLFRDSKLKTALIKIKESK